jgi:dihydroorotase
MPQTLTLIRPDDWHLHLRDGPLMASVVPHSARQFARAIVMPNLKPPITTVALAAEYRARILAALPPGTAFEPLMTLYLTDATSVAEIEKAAASGFVRGVKLYPAGATTHSDAGVTRIDKIHVVLAAMERLRLPLLVHGEVTDPAIDIFDREKVFIDTVLSPLIRDFPGLKVVLEHITTSDAVDFVREGGPNLGATVTAHHLRYNRNALFQGGIRPHWYCLPVLKRETHRRALIGAVTSGASRFFLGTDSAPHTKSAKESACGCAGCYTAPAALALYAEVFSDAGALGALEAFASCNGPDFYGLPRNRERVTLLRDAHMLPACYPCPDNETLIPLGAGETLRWRLQE